MLKKVITLAVFFAMAMTAYAQDGIIRVTVFDDELGEPLIGANVVIEGTTNGAVTDLDGKAAITNLAAGTYNVQVSYVSFQTQTIRDIQLDAGETETFNVKLLVEDYGLEEVVVTAEAIKSSESALLTVQKKSPVVLDAISADMFSRNGDSDAGAAIKRVSGVTVQGGKYVYVRGLGDRYSKTVLNGADLPGLDPNRNSVQLDLFPSNLIDNIIVYKTFSPNLPGDFSGGLVDINTKDFPDRYTMQVNASLGYNTVASFNDQFLSYEGGSLDFLGIDDGTRELPGEIAQYNNANFPQPYVNNQELDNVTKSFNNNEFEPGNKTALLNQSLSFAIGDQFEVGTSQVGLIGSVSYDRDYAAIENGFIGRYSGISSSVEDLEANTNFLLDDEQGTESVTWGAMLAGAIKFNNNHKIQATALRNQSGIKEARYLEGNWSLTGTVNPWVDDENFYQTRTLYFKERHINTGQLQGTHYFPALKNLQVEWLGSYSAGSFDEPDIRFFTNNYLTESEGDTIFTQSNLNRPGRYFRNMDETSLDLKLDFTLPVTVWNEREAKIRFGGAYLKKDRDYAERRLEYSRGGGAERYAGDIDTYLAESNLGLLGPNEFGLYLIDGTREENSYDAAQKIYGTYAMAELPITDKFNAIFGARMESTDQDLATKNPLPSTGEKITGNIKEVDILPSLNLTYELQENMNLRAAYGRTLARPSFREFAPLVTFSFQGDPNLQGNPDLQRTLIDNYDLRWEWYPATSEYLSASVFYKNMDNPIERTVNPENNNLQFEYQNVDQATIMGVEVEARKTLGFISPLLTNFRASVNVTLVESEVNLSDQELVARRVFDPNADDTRPLYNQSPFIINAGLGYSNPETRWDVNAAFNVLGKRITAVSLALPYIYEQPRPDLTLTVKKGISDHWSIKAKASNLLNSTYREELNYNGRDYTWSNFNTGQTFSLGVTYLVE